MIEEVIRQTEEIEKSSLSTHLNGLYINNIIEELGGTLTALPGESLFPITSHYLTLLCLRKMHQEGNGEIK